MAQNNVLIGSNSLTSQLARSECRIVRWRLLTLAQNHSNNDVASPVRDAGMTV